jgi:hypothetical protein
VTEDDGRCTVARLDVSDLRRSLDDPGLRALLAKNWQVLASIVIDGPDGQHLHLVLRPPVQVQVPAVPLTSPTLAPWIMVLAVALWPIVTALFVRFL